MRSVASRLHNFYCKTNKYIGPRSMAPHPNSGIGQGNNDGSLPTLQQIVVPPKYTSTYVSSLSGHVIELVAVNVKPKATMTFRGPIGLVCHELRQSVAQGRLQMGEAGAIGSPKIHESKAKEKRRRRKREQWFTDGFICPLRVTRRLRAVRLPTCSLPLANRPQSRPFQV